ncbi:MAG: PaaI family thioesterase [Rhizobiales bacterium]|nr:PaaI family thioesterase [Hyphomicrobiales bacterium]
MDQAVNAGRGFSSRQHGFVHGGAVSTIADTAAGYAAVSLMPPDTAALTTELKINFMRPRAASASSRAAKWSRPGDADGGANRRVH